MKPFGKVSSSSLYYLFSFFLFVALFFNEVSSYPFTRPPISQSTTITHQAHSFDDLGEWRQLIAKGTNFIKVDLKYSLAEFCANQSRVRNQDNRGCYLLAHDTPLAYNTYYTAQDILAFVFDPDNQYLFRNTSHFYLYISFKNNRDRFPPANFTQSGELQKEFITFFTVELRKRNMTDYVQLVYDGNYLDEFGKSYPWFRTYGFQTADLKNNASCLYSNKGRCKNMAVINNMANPLPFVDPSSSILRLCEASYGRFNESKHPMVFYEPTDQKTTWALLDTYLGCGQEHAPGFAVSINVDPVQFDVFSGTRSGKAWNQRLFDEAKWAHPIPISYNNSQSSFVTLFLAKDNQIMYTFAHGTLDAVASNGVFPFGALTHDTPRQLSSVIPFAASPFQKLKTFSFSAGGKDYILVSDFRGNTGVYNIDTAGQNLVSVASTTFTHKQSESVTLINASVVTNNEYHIGNSQVGWIKIEFLQGYVSYRRSECTFFLQWWQLWFDPKGKFHSELLPVGESTCAAYSPFELPLPVASASVALHPVPRNSTAGSSYCVNATHVGLIVLSSQKNIHGGVLCVSTKTNEVKVCTDSACTQTQAQLQQQGTAQFPTLPALDVGTFPSLSITSLPSGEPVVLEVHGDGYCYNSDWNNKRAFPNICESTPVSSRYVLNYNYGKLESWASHIFSKKGLITSCDSAIFHGVYDEGSLPSAFLLIDKKNNVRMVEAHTGFPKGAVDYAGCSYPIPYDGAMIDGIVLPDVSQMVGKDWAPSEALMKFVTPRNNYDNNVWAPSGEATIATSICNMCRQRFFIWQTKFQSDYELMHALTKRISDMCAVGQLLVGDGTVAGCKNLILLYLPALATDLAGDIFSPDNCLLMVCGGNSSASVLPDINGQVSRSLPLEPENNAAQEVFSDDDDDDPDIEILAEDVASGGAWRVRAVDPAQDATQDAAQQGVRKVIYAAMKAQLQHLLGL